MKKPSFFKFFLTSQLRINVFATSSCTAINILLLFVSYPIFLHFLGYQRYGLWAVLATMLNLINLGCFGVDQALVKLIAEEHKHGNILAVQRYLTSSFYLLLTNAIILTLIVIYFQKNIFRLFNILSENQSVAERLFPFIAILSIFGLLSQALLGAISGLGRIDFGSYLNVAGRFSGLAISIILLIFGGGIESLLLGNAICYAFIIIFGAIYLKWKHSLAILNPYYFHVKSLMKSITFGGSLFFASLFNIMLFPLNKVILSRYAGLSSVAVYEISFNSTMQLRSLVERGLQALIPEVSKLSSSGNKTAYAVIDRINKKALAFKLCVLPVYAVLFIFSSFFLKLWLQDKYVIELLWVFRVMLLGSFAGLMCVAGYFTLIGLGKIREIIISQILQTSMNIIAVVVFFIIFSKITPFYVAISTSFAMLMTSIYVIGRKRFYLKRML